MKPRELVRSLQSIACGCALMTDGVITLCAFHEAGLGGRDPEPAPGMRKIRLRSGRLV